MALAFSNLSEISVRIELVWRTRHLLNLFDCTGFGMGPRLRDLSSNAYNPVSWSHGI